MSNRYYEHCFPNGLHLIVEPMPDVKSGAFTFLVPAGIIHDPDDGLGTANLLSNLVTRGAGERDSRALTSALDSLGVHRTESTEVFYTSFTAAALGTQLVPALELFADMVRRPRLETEQLEFCKSATLQEIQAIEDEPAQKLFIELRRRALPEPLGRPILGRTEDVSRCTATQTRAFHSREYQPNGAVLGVAGAVKFEEIRDQIGRLMADWAPVPGRDDPVGARQPSSDHIFSEKVQTQIGIAFESVAYGDDDYFNAHGAVGVLSGGMSSRLFTEVREKRGLCYGVGASYLAMKNCGRILCHASTTNERARETLEVILSELERLRHGIEWDEVRRLQAGLKSSLIMQEESTSARASILARSWFNLGRVRSVEEVARAIDNLSPASILDYLERHPPGNYNILTLGPQSLEAA